MSGVLKDSIVFTLDGHKSIQELQVGDKLLTHHNHYREVKEIQQTEHVKDDLLVIKAWGCRPLVVNKETELQVFEIGNKRTEWAQAKDLHNYHMLATTNRVDDENLIYCSRSYAEEKFEMLIDIIKKYIEQCGECDQTEDIRGKPEYEKYLELLTDEEKSAFDDFHEWSKQSIMKVISNYLENGGNLLPQPFTDKLYHLTRHIGFTMFDENGFVSRTSRDEIMKNRYVDEKTGVDYFHFTVEPYEGDETTCYNVLMDEDPSFTAEAFVIHS